MTNEQMISKSIIAITFTVIVNKINEKEYLLANAKSNYTYALRYFTISQPQ